MWFPRLASDRVLRARPVEGPFAITLNTGNANRIHCLNEAAEQQGLARGMPLADARAFCPGLQTSPADDLADRRFLRTLSRWAATRYCPWVGLEGENGLVLDITGSSHLFGGEEEMIADMHDRLARSSITVRIGLTGTRGAAWALAHYGLASTQDVTGLPVAALRLDGQMVTALERLGLKTIADLENAARPPLARRFGPELMMRLDQALGRQSEPVTPLGEPPHYGVRMTLPEPIGLRDDVMAGTSRLLERLCARLKAQETGARILRLDLRRVDQEARTVELRLARPMNDPASILSLFERGIGDVDAGYGIDQMRLAAIETGPVPVSQLSHVSTARKDRLDDLISRLGTRIGLDSIRRFLPSDSHIPERSFIIAPAAHCQPPHCPAEGSWTSHRPRPLRLFPPEPLPGTGHCPPGRFPERFQWRRMLFTTARATGPERIAPEWWHSDGNWRSGMRDYWYVETSQGRRLWLYYTPQNPAWFVHGEFA